MSDSSSPDEINQVEVLDGLIRDVQTAHAKVQKAGANALAAGMDAGDALIVIQGRITVPLKRWMAENMPKIGFSTAKLYMWLARHRAEIEGAREQDPHLSIREARRLFAEKKPSKPAGMETAAVIITDEQLIAALTARGPDWFVTNMPEGWRAWLQARLRGPVLRAVAAAHPNTRMKNVVKLVHSADQPTTHH
jgi:hypothetical protein